MSSDVHEGPLTPAPSTEVHQGPLEPNPVATEKYRKTGRERRWERRRRRRVFEEAMGWVMVPIILLAAYWGVKAVLGALGTTPTELYRNIQATLSGRP